MTSRPRCASRAERVGRTDLIYTEDPGWTSLAAGRVCHYRLETASGTRYYARRQPDPVRRQIDRCARADRRPCRADRVARGDRQTGRSAAV